MDKIRVLHSVKFPGKTTNPYIISLTEATSRGASPMYFSWRTALVGRFSILHVHWPEHLFRGSGWIRVPKALLGWALILRLLISRKSVVWTVHNLSPHEQGGFFERVFLRCFQRCVSHRIYLTDPGSLPAESSRSSLIPHGHYRDWYKTYPPAVPVQSRYVFCGLIRPYKGVESLVGAFRELSVGNETLVLAGKPHSSTYGDEIQKLVSSDVRIKSWLEYVSDGDLVRHVTEAMLVVLPYRHIGNSGVLLMSLSLNRPVLLPQSDLADYMKSVVGEEWIYTYEGELSAVHLRSAMEKAKGVLHRSPDLTRFEWPAIGDAHLEVYRAVLDR